MQLFVHICKCEQLSDLGEEIIHTPRNIIDMKIQKCTDSVREGRYQLVTNTNCTNPLLFQDICGIDPFHPFVLIAWLADGDSLTCYIVMMGRLIAQMFSTFSL